MSNTYNPFPERKLPRIVLNVCNSIFCELICFANNGVSQYQSIFRSGTCNNAKDYQYLFDSLYDSPPCKTILQISKG